MKYGLLMIGLILFASCSFNKSTGISEIYNMHDHLEPKAADNMRIAMAMANITKTVVLGSPDVTLYRNTKKGFYGYDKNNEAIIELAAKYDDIIAYCTVWPLDTDNLAKFKTCVEKGSTGLKLYSGHSLFYDSSLNITSMYPLYSYLEQNDIPILFHVNPGRSEVMKEFEAVLRDFSGIRINCPHFCLSSINTKRFEYLMDNYPNLYTDISFGAYVEDGLKRISRNVSKYRAIFEKYSDRIFFGTDIVITNSKSVEWIYNLTMCYRGMLEKDKYICKVEGIIDAEYNGLNLTHEIVNKIYFENPRKFLKED